jgi:hypothetical protein
MNVGEHSARASVAIRQRPRLLSDRASAVIQPDRDNSFFNYSHFDLWTANVSKLQAFRFKSWLGLNADMSRSPLFVSRMSNIEQRQHCESRIFYFSPGGRDRWHRSWLLHEFTRVRKRELQSRIFVSSVQFLLTLLNDFQRMGFTIGSLQKLGRVTRAG